MTTAVKEDGHNHCGHVECDGEFVGWNAASMGWMATTAVATLTTGVEA